MRFFWLGRSRSNFDVPVPVRYPFGCSNLLTRSVLDTRSANMLRIPRFVWNKTVPTN